MAKHTFRIYGDTPLMMSAPNNEPATAPELRRFIAAAYYDKDGFYLPGDMFFVSARSAADNRGIGKEYMKGVRLATARAPLFFEGPDTPEALFHETEFVDKRPGRLNGESVMLVRPVFQEWESEVVFRLKEDVITPQMMLELLTEAGEDIGVGGFRQRFGRFEVELAPNEEPEQPNE